MSYPRHPRLSWWWAVRCLGCEGLIWYIQAKSMTWYSQIIQRVFSITILHSHIAKLLGLTSTFEAFGLGVSFQAGKRPVLKSLHTTTPTRLRSAGKWHPSPPRRPLALRVWFCGLPELCWMLFSVWRISDGLVKIFVVWKLGLKVACCSPFFVQIFFWATDLSSELRSRQMWEGMECEK